MQRIKEYLLNESRDFTSNVYKVRVNPSIEQR